jgi:shikimate dehydrogenase
MSKRLPLPRSTTPDGLRPQAINGATRLVGLLGDPVAHSLSPAIHNHAFACLGLPMAYVPLAVKEADLPAAISALRAFGFAGANVTIPHKQSVARLCDTLSDLSRVTGTVNTLYFENGKLCGTTTDPQGFGRALAAMKCDPRKANIVILGNGGLSRTLCFSLALDKTPKRLCVVGREENKVRGLVDEVKKTTGFEIEWSLFDKKDLRDVLRDCTLLVNGTSVGMHPHANASPLGPDCFHKGMVVLDTVYNPAKTLFLQYAAKAGCKAQNGLRMLLFQGLASFKYWTGVDAPEKIFDIDVLQRMVTG